MCQSGSSRHSSLSAPIATETSQVDSIRLLIRDLGCLALHPGRLWKSLGHLGYCEATGPGLFGKFDTSVALCTLHGLSGARQEAKQMWLTGMESSSGLLGSWKQSIKW